MEKRKVGDIVSTGPDGGMTGEVVGIAFESGLAGNFYIIRILDKGSLASGPHERDIEAVASNNNEPTWIRYPYEYTVLSGKVLITTPEDVLSTLRVLGKIPNKIVCSGDYLTVQNEQKMRDAVKDLKISDVHLTGFLENAAKEYLKSSGMRGEVVEVYPLDFIVRLKVHGLGIRHIRVPIADFFEGKSDLPMRMSIMKNTLKELKPVVTGKISDTPNVSSDVVNDWNHLEGKTEKGRVENFRAPITKKRSHKTKVSKTSPVITLDRIPRVKCKVTKMDNP